MNVGDLGKLIVSTGMKRCPKYNKLPNLVTLSPNNYLRKTANAFTIEMEYIEHTSCNTFYPFQNKTPNPLASTE